MSPRPAAARIADALTGAVTPADNTRIDDDRSAIARRYADLYRTSLRIDRNRS
jgi:hypothetical protein